jgi:hypothetical protein
MQPKILTILHPAKNVSNVILPFVDARATAYQEKIDFRAFFILASSKLRCFRIMFIKYIIQQVVEI